MENNTLQAEVTNQQPVTEKPCCNKKSKALLYIGLAFAFLLIISLVAYTAYLLGKESKDDDIPVNEANKAQTVTTETQEVTSTTSSAVGDPYEGWDTLDGEFVSLKNPSDWTVEEVTEDEFFKGFVGIYIYDESEDMIFRLYYNVGVGGIIDCNSSFTQFLDGDPAKLQAWLDIRETEMNCENELEVITLDDEYTEFTVLGNRVRRIENEYYVDKSEGEEYFDLEVPFNVLDYDGGVIMKETNTEAGNNSYFIDITVSQDSQPLSSESLKKLDNILSSLEEK